MAILKVARLGHPVLRKVAELRSRREPHDEGCALGAEWVAEHDVGQRGEEVAVSAGYPGGHALNVCQTNIKCYQMVSLFQ